MKKFNLNLLYSILIGSSVLGSAIGLTACNGGSNGGGSNPAVFTSSNQDSGKECSTSNVATDSTGNLYTNTNCLDNSGINTYTLTKLSPTGDTIFSRSLIMNPTGATNVNVAIAEATGIAIDSKNNIYVSSYIEVPDIITPAPYSDPQIAGIVYKYDSKGNLVWKHDFSNSDYMIKTKAITVDHDGNPIVVGEMINRDAVFADVTPYFIEKLNAATGTQLFFKAQAIHNGKNTANSVAVDENNNIIVHGVAPRKYKEVLEQNDSLLIKYNSAGEEQWLHLDAVTNYIGELKRNSQVITNGTDIYISGNVMGDFFESNFAADVTYYVARYSANGDLVWGKQGIISPNYIPFINGLTLNKATNTLYFGITEYNDENISTPYIVSYTTNGSYLSTQKMLNSATTGRTTSITDVIYNNNELYATGLSNDPVLDMNGTFNLGGFITSNIPQ